MSKLLFFLRFSVYFPMIWSFSIAMHNRIHNDFSSFFSLLTTGPHIVASGPYQLSFQPSLNPNITPLNTGGTGADQKNVIKAFSHKGFWESRFPARFCFQWKAITQ